MKQGRYRHKERQVVNDCEIDVFERLDPSNREPRYRLIIRNPMGDVFFDESDANVLPLVAQDADLGMYKREPEYLSFT